MIRYIVDGHNLIHTIPVYLDLLDRSYIGALDAVERDVVSYVHGKELKVILIFDGNPPGDRAPVMGGVSVLFSGRDRDADSLIAEKAGNWRGRQTVVVSRDRHVMRSGASLGCKTLSPEDFYRLLKQKKRGKTTKPLGPKGKSAGLAPHQVESWKKVMEKALAEKKRRG